MKGLEITLRKLLTSNYMTAFLGENSLINVKLLENGKSVSNNLFTEWLNSKESFKREYILDTDCLNCASLTHLKKIYPAALALKEKKNPNPLVIKQRIKGFDMLSRKNNFLHFATKEYQNKLVCDYIINSSKMLQCFYYIQRQRKLWWMRFSENPSGFYFDSSSESQNDGFSQTITIRTRLPFASMSVEEIACMPLKEDANFPKKLVLLNTNSQHIQPSIIRTTIHLEKAICALLLDSCISSPEGTMSLNRKLVPSQCALLCQQNETVSGLTNDLEDLRSHISDILTTAGIRIFTKKKITTNNKLQLEAHLSSFDKIGIPYVIVLEERSLHDGLLKLRNRDTLLQETIHISDLPTYILQLINFGPVR